MRREYEIPDRGCTEREEHGHGGEEGIRRGEEGFGESPDKTKKKLTK
jgi:hypothetical protein